MSVKKTVWLSSQSEQTLNEIKDGLTKGQKDHLERSFRDVQMIGRGGSRYKKYILSQAIEIGLLSLKREYSIEQALTDDEQASTKEKKLNHGNEKELPIDDMIKDYLSGMGFVQLGAKYKIAHSTAFRRIKATGIKRSSKGDK
mgnify:CR=1 FL=1